MTVGKISVVLFFNILKMCYKQIKKMIFTALTLIFVLSSGSSQIARSDLLTGTDHENYLEQTTQMTVRKIGL